MNTSLLVPTVPPEGASSSALPSGRIPELDGLRGLAILLVVIAHYIAYALPDAAGGGWRAYSDTSAARRCFQGLRSRPPAKVFFRNRFDLFCQNLKLARKLNDGKAAQEWV